MNPSLGYINLLARLTELREKFYLPHYHFIIKGYDKTYRWTPVWKTYRARYGKGCGASVLLCSDRLTPVIWGFEEISSHKYN